MSWADIQRREEFHQPFDDPGTSEGLGGDFYFTDSRIEHLRQIQDVVRRMARNSFTLKGWSISVISITLAILAERSTAGGLRIDFAVLAIPALCFWGLDAYYLCQERLFRDLYNAAILPHTRVPLFSLNPLLCKTSSTPGGLVWLRTCFNRTVAPIHGPLLGIVLSLDGVNGGWFTTAVANSFSQMLR